MLYPEISSLIPIFRWNSGTSCFTYYSRCKSKTAIESNSQIFTGQLYFQYHYVFLLQKDEWWNLGFCLMSFQFRFEVIHRHTGFYTVVIVQKTIC